jgi:hypothetical protein
MLLYIVGIAFELLEVERRVVVKPLVSRPVQKFVECVIVEFSALPPFVFGENLRLC